jgi:hypothetical protein
VLKLFVEARAMMMDEIAPDPGHRLEVAARLGEVLHGGRIVARANGCLSLSRVGLTKVEL